jgi:hypothetical protein
VRQHRPNGEKMKRSCVNVTDSRDLIGVSRTSLGRCCGAVDAKEGVAAVLRLKFDDNMKGISRNGRKSGDGPARTAVDNKKTTLVLAVVLLVVALEIFKDVPENVPVVLVITVAGVPQSVENIFFYQEPFFARKKSSAFCKLVVKPTHYAA